MVKALSSHRKRIQLTASRLKGHLWRGPERIQCRKSNRNKADSDQRANISPAASRDWALRNPPFRREEPQAVSKVPRRTNDPDHVEPERPGREQLVLHFAECRRGIRQQVHTAEPQMPGVPHHVEESDCARPALRRIHPVPGPGIFGHVALSARPDIKAIKRVIKNRQPYAEQFKSEDKRKTAEERNLPGISAWALGGECVGDKMLDQKQPDWNNSAE